MKISYNWLKTLIDTDLLPDQTAEMLTNCGLEVESSELYENIKGSLTGVVVGQVVECEKHPNADRLRVTKVDVGTGTHLQIVCGAANVAAGQKVLVAMVGAKLFPTNGEAFEISKSKIRGEISEGMICAEDELGLGKSHDGIMVLAETCLIGKPASEYFSIYSDIVFEIGLTANRGDATGHLGVARDLKALTGREIKQNNYTIPESINPKSNIKVEIEDLEGCHRYSGICLSGIQVKESPEWMQNMLKAIGVNPINNIVDITNFVLHETGQPLHAFDLNKIAGDKIIVKTVNAANKFKTLDEVERTLNGNECMICDAEKALAIGGVFGGMDSGISENTTDIFIESAHFNPASIRKAAKSHGLNTDASFRFERGTDPNITISALRRSVQLILEITGASVSSDIIDVYPNPIENRIVNFSIQKSNLLIGADIDKQEILKILNRLDIEIVKDNGDLLELSIPPYRVDVTRAVDVTEEILRIYGFNKIEIGDKISSSIALSETESKVKLKNKIANSLSNKGFYEISTNSLSKSSYYNDDKNLVKILNPLSSDLDTLRPEMLYSFLEAIQYNRNRKNNDLRLFEFGKTYKTGAEEKDIQNAKSFVETSKLVLALSGRKNDESWNNTEQKVSYYDLKLHLENVLKLSGSNEIEFNASTSNYLGNFGTYSIFNTEIAILGSVNAKILKNFDIENEVWYAEIYFDRLFDLALKSKFRLKPVSVFPSVRRDLALVIEQTVTYQQLEKLAYDTVRGVIKSINAFDVYEGDKIEKGKKSYALSFILQDENKTLTDVEIEGTMKKLIKAYEKNLGATLRS